MNNDAVKHPSHYVGNIETIDFIKDKLGWGHIFYCIGNVIKYASRYDKKGKPLEDLQKAETYLQWAIDELNDEETLGKLQAIFALMAEKQPLEELQEFLKLSKAADVKELNEKLQKGRCK